MVRREFLKDSIYAYEVGIEGELFIEGEGLGKALQAMNDKECGALILSLPGGPNKLGCSGSTSG